MNRLFAVLLAALFLAAPALAQKGFASLKQRQQIYNAVVKAQDRAAREARTLVPLPKRGTSEDAATEKKRLAIIETREKLYVDRVRKEWGLTQTQLKAVVREGVDKRWPLPRL